MQVSCLRQTFVIFRARDGCKRHKASSCHEWIAKTAFLFTPIFEHVQHISEVYEASQAIAWYCCVIYDILSLDPRLCFAYKKRKGKAASNCECAYLCVPSSYVRNSSPWFNALRMYGIEKFSIIWVHIGFQHFTALSGSKALCSTISEFDSLC